MAVEKGIGFYGRTLTAATGVFSRESELTLWSCPDVCRVKEERVPVNEQMGT